MLTVAFWLLPSKKKLYNIHTAQYICVKKRCKVMLILAAQAVRFQRQIMPYINFSVRQMMLLSKAVPWHSFQSFLKKYPSGLYFIRDKF